MTHAAQMTPDEIFEAAGKGQELHGLPPAEDALYSRARLIYNQFRHGELTAEQGAERKRIAMAKYDQAKEWERFEKRWVDRATQLYKEVEQAAADYTKAPGYKTADALWMSVYGVQRKIAQEERGDFFADADAM